MSPGEVVSHAEMCVQEGISLQRGMNFRPKGGQCVLLMSTRSGAPYADEVQDEGRTLIYEGHDIPKTSKIIDPKSQDQRLATPTGASTDNGKFYQAAMDFKQGTRVAETVRVYEKMRPGIWVFNGEFQLVDAWSQMSNGRQVFKFKLEIIGHVSTEQVSSENELDHVRMIPSHVKREVWQRDNGACVQCGSSDNLHFDHIIPFSKGGTSLTAENIQLLCARHNLQKRDQIL